MHRRVTIYGSKHMEAIAHTLHADIDSPFTTSPCRYRDITENRVLQAGAVLVNVYQTIRIFSVFV